MIIDRRNDHFELIAIHARAHFVVAVVEYLDTERRRHLRSGRPGRLPPPVENYRQKVGPAENALLDSVLSCSAVGSPDTVRVGLAAFIERTGADELMITSQVHDHAARLRSYEIVASLKHEVTAARV